MTWIWMLSLPWGKKSKTSSKDYRARGSSACYEDQLRPSTRSKERILEYLAVQ
jgi:ATP-dependent Lon protease